MTPEDIRTARKRLKATQADLARLLSVDASQVSRWERGRKLPTVLQEAALTRFLKKKFPKRFNLHHLLTYTPPEQVLATCL